MKESSDMVATRMMLAVAEANRHVCCCHCRRAQFPRETVMKESSDVIAAIRKTYPSIKKIGVAG
jgi:hypothetical protein